MSDKQKQCSRLGTCMGRQWSVFRHSCLWEWLHPGTFHWMINPTDGQVRRSLLCWHPFSGCFMLVLYLRTLQKQYKILRALVPSLRSLPLFSFFKAKNKNSAFLILLTEFKDVMIILFQEELSALQTVLRCTPSMGAPHNLWLTETMLKCNIS